MTKIFLDKNEVAYLPLPYNSVLKGFNNDTVNCCTKGMFNLQFHENFEFEAELIVLHGKNYNYDGIIGFDLQKQLRMNLDLTGETPLFRMNDMTLPVHALFDQILTLNGSESSHALSDQSVVLRGGDVFYLSVLNKGLTGFYEVELDQNLADQGLAIEGPSELMFKPLKKRSLQPSVTMLGLKLYQSNKKILPIAKGQVIGTLREVEIPSDQNLVNPIEVKKVQYEKPELITFYLERTKPTEEHVLAVRKSQEERKNWWTKEKIEAKGSDWLPKIPAPIRGHVVDLLLKHSHVMVRGMEDLRFGLVGYSMKAKLPPHLYKQVTYRAPSPLMKKLYGRVQKYMIEYDLAEPTSNPLFTHPFSLVVKKLPSGQMAVMPATEDAIDELTNEDLRRFYRIINDCSMLTPHTEQSMGYLSPMVESLNAIKDDCLVSLFDVKDSYHQVNINDDPLFPNSSHCTRDLFSFYSFIPGQDYLRARKIPMGFTTSGNFCSHIFRRIIEAVNLTPIWCSVEEFSGHMKRLYEDEEFEVRGKSDYIQVKSYLDDNVVTTPCDPKDLEKLPLKKSSFFFEPKNALEATFSLHLNVLSKILTNLTHFNLCLSIQKMELLCSSFTLLGFRFEKIENRFVKSVPEKRIKEILDIQPPKSVLELTQTLGFFNFFAHCFANARQLLFPLVCLLRKGTDYHWSETHQKCFDLIKQRLLRATLDGYTMLSNCKRISAIYLFSDWSRLSNSAAATLFVKDFESKQLRIGMFWSKLLSKTFLKKPSYLCEIAAAVLALLSLKGILMGRPIFLAVDNQAACRILENRHHVVGECEDGVLHRLLLSIEGYPYRVVYINSKSQVADFLSRNPAKNDPSQPIQVKLKSSAISDLEDEPYSLYDPEECVESFLENYEKKSKLVCELAQANWDVDQLQTEFRDSHVFPSRIKELSSSVSVVTEIEDAEMESKLSVCKIEEIKTEATESCLHIEVDSKKRFTRQSSMGEGRVDDKEEDLSDVSKEDLEVWGKFHDMNDLKIPEKPNFEQIHCTNLFSDSEEELDDNFFRTKKDNDVINYLSRDSRINPYTEKFMRDLRCESEGLGTNSHCLTILKSEGQIPNCLYDDRLHLSLFIQEMMVINKISREAGQVLSDEPLFLSRAQVLRAIESMRLASHVKSRLTYLKACQANCEEISLIIDLLNGKADEEKVDLKKRTSVFFKVLTNQLESLFLIEGLLVRVRFSLKGESHLMQVVLGYHDSYRKAIQCHSRNHRRFIYTYVSFASSFYTYGAMKLILDVIKQCQICNSMEPRRRLKCERLSLQTGRTFWYLDHKGKIGSGYILVAVESLFRLVNFTWVADCTAETTAKAIFQNIIANYGSCCSFMSDRGTAFTSKLNTTLFELGSISHVTSSAFHPNSELAETLGIRVLCKSLRANFFNQNPSKLKEQVKTLQFLTNCTMKHPYLGSSSYNALMGSEQGFFHPALEQKDNRVKYPKFWDDRIDFMAKIVQLFSDKYDLQLTQMRTLRHTVSSLKINVGDLVYYRIFLYPESANFLKSLMPKFNLARVTKILGPTALILKDEKSGREISRHLVDTYKAEFSSSFPNLYLSSFDSVRNECLEEETRNAFQPELSGQYLAEKQAAENQVQSQKSQESSDRVLRPRKPVKYGK